MIPLGKQAFVPGTLQGEQVTVIGRDGAEHSLSRTDAVAFFEEERKSLIPKKPKSVLKKKAAVKSTIVESSAVPEAGALPFLEIREGVDGGNGEVINMTEQLKSHGADEASHVNESKEEAFEVLPQSTPKVLSDREYDMLSARLEELMRLEEESQRSSSSTSKSKGWAKGFLNVTPKKPAASRKPVANNPKPNPEPPTTELRDSEAAPRERKVAFSADNEVKEIPRVGERSVSSLPKPGSRPIDADVLATGIVATRNQSLGQPLGSEGPKQLAVSVTNPVVERPRRSKAVNKESDPPKKLSRFAQERLMRG